MRNIDSHRRFILPVACLAFLAHAGLILAPASRAQDLPVQIEPADAKIEFSLDSTLHTVHGTFALKSSSLRFDRSSGRISGAIVVDATSGESGNSGRDKRMHHEILESAKFPEIVFTPQQVQGNVNADGASKITVSGKFHLHGQDHDETLPMDVTVQGQTVRVSCEFVIPYVEWGLKNPSNFLLRASDKVKIDIHATGHLIAGDAPH